MEGNGGINSRNGAVASVSAAATEVGLAEARFNPPQDQHRRWWGCLGGLSCFRSQKGGKRIVPASRIPDINISGNRSNGPSNGPQPGGVSVQTTALAPSLLAPPSSPASFTNSALPSTAQSPNCFPSLSANVCSPGGPSSTMFTTGPYAHETQLVSPPVFSTFTTEPSTAPLTPPPELAHLTTPSSPDVPFARLLSSSLDLKGANKEDGLNIPYGSVGYVSAVDLQATYQLYPGSPASHLVSPKSGLSTNGVSSPYPEQEFPAHWSALIASQETFYPENQSTKLFGSNTPTSRNLILSQDSSFFCPAASAQFYLDQAQQPYGYHHCAGRISISRETDAFSNHRHSKACKSDAEEIEAYRASFGFSADEIITAPHYVEPLDMLDESFTMIPFATSKPYTKECIMPNVKTGEEDIQAENLNLPRRDSSTSPKFKNGEGDNHGFENVSDMGCTDSETKTRKDNEDISTSGSSSNQTIVCPELVPSNGGSEIGEKSLIGLANTKAEPELEGRSTRNSEGEGLS